MMPMPSRLPIFPLLFAVAAIASLAWPVRPVDPTTRRAARANSLPTAPAVRSPVAPAPTKGCPADTAGIGRGAARPRDGQRGAAAPASCGP